MHRSAHFRTMIWFVLLVPLMLTSSGIMIGAPVPLIPPSTSFAGGGRQTPLVTKGCGKPAPMPPGMSEDKMLFSDGLTRTYLLHVPLHYVPTQRIPLVLSFHGHGSWAGVQEHMTGFSTLADQRDFLVVYPQGTVGPDGETGWATGPRKDPTVNDVRFVSDLLTYLQTILCVDPQRIYVTGFSNGGGMAALLACMMAGRIAAFAPVSGSYFPLAGGCHPDRPVPILEAHGTADLLVPYAGSVSLRLPSIPAWLAGWVMRDGCTSHPRIIFQSGAVTGERWFGCEGNVSITHYRINGGAHTWPETFGLSGTTSLLHISNLIWSFFQSYPLPEQR